MISGGRIRLPPSAAWRMPLRDSQIANSTKPPPAVRTQVISAAHSIETAPRFARPRLCKHLNETGADLWPTPVRYRIRSVAAAVFGAAATIAVAVLDAEPSEREHAVDRDPARLYEGARGDDGQRVSGRSGEGQHRAARVDRDLGRRRVGHGAFGLVLVLVLVLVVGLADRDERECVAGAGLDEQLDLLSRRQRRQGHAGNGDLDRKTLERDDERGDAHENALDLDSPRRGDRREVVLDEIAVLELDLE